MFKFIKLEKYIEYINKTVYIGVGGTGVGGTGVGG
jgi:hypothetical protein